MGGGGGAASMAPVCRDSLVLVCRAERGLYVRAGQQVISAGTMCLPSPVPLA